ncbi:hypothetical protein MCEMSHM24_02430 [Comamonadaceae bacterium]
MNPSKLTLGRPSKLADPALQQHINQLIQEGASLGFVQQSVRSAPFNVVVGRSALYAFVKKNGLSLHNTPIERSEDPWGKRYESKIRELFEAALTYVEIWDKLVEDHGHESKDLTSSLTYEEKSSRIGGVLYRIRNRRTRTRKSLSEFSAPSIALTRTQLRNTQQSATTTGVPVESSAGTNRAKPLPVNTTGLALQKKALLESQRTHLSETEVKELSQLPGWIPAQ